jgi:hypothetical protein
MMRLLKVISFTIALLLLHTVGYARFIQIHSSDTLIKLKHVSPDPHYISDYYNRHLIVRFYFSNKYNSFKFFDHGDRLLYKPNSHNNLGVGFNYKFIGLNIGLNMPFLTKDNAVYGETKYLDLQSHLYLNKYVVDFYGQFYRGYYISNPATAVTDAQPGAYPLRPDIRTKNIGIFAQYVPNFKHFSFNAPYYQNEYQKKSAGSLIVGGGIYYTDAHGDSAIIPSNIKYTNFYDHNDFDLVYNSGIALSMGYAYTLVIKGHFFITASPNLGAGINYSDLSNTFTHSHDGILGPQYNLSIRFAIGYNSEHYFVGMNFVDQVTENKVPGQGNWYEVNAGNTRFVIAKRFKTKKRTFLDEQPIIQSH